MKTSEGTTSIAFGSPGETDADIVVDYEEIRHLAGWPTPPANWQTTWQADMSDTDEWVLDGDAQITHENGVLDVKAETAMVLWPDHTVHEPVMIDFEAKTEDEKARCILFFMAEGLNGEDIFGWGRQGEYGDYAYEETMELYSVGMMRQGAGTGSNLREMGGIIPDNFKILLEPRNELSEDQKEQWAQAFRDFQPYTIRSATADGYEVGEWMRYRVIVDNGIVRIFGDDRLLHEYIDKEPLHSGRFGFRNFRPGTSMQIRNLRVAKPQ